MTHRALAVRHRKQALEVYYKYTYALRQSLAIIRLTWERDVSWKGLELMVLFYSASNH